MRTRTTEKATRSDEAQAAEGNNPRPPSSRVPPHRVATRVPCAPKGHAIVAVGNAHGTDNAHISSSLFSLRPERASQTVARGLARPFRAKTMFGGSVPRAMPSATMDEAFSLDFMGDEVQAAEGNNPRTPSSRVPPRRVATCVPCAPKGHAIVAVGNAHGMDNAHTSSSLFSIRPERASQTVARGLARPFRAKTMSGGFRTGGDAPGYYGLPFQGKNDFSSSLTVGDAHGYYGSGLRPDGIFELGI